MPRWSKIVLKVFAAVIVLVLVVYIALAAYVNVNKKSLLATVTKQLNKNLNGTMTIKSMDPTFLSGFPGISLRLKDVIIRDSLWNTHKHNLLEAKDFDVSVNIMSLLKGTIEIGKISINNSTIYLYTDSNGYSNTAVFKKKKQKEKKEAGSSSMEIGKLSLNNVNFVVDNKKGHKLFQFVVDDLKAKIDYPFLGGWEADLKMKTLAKSMAFNTRRGSFIKNKVLEGPFNVTYNDKSGIINVAPNKLNIGNDPFIIGAQFDTSKENTDFSINIEAPDILWRNASALLAPNITSKLNMFNLNEPIHVKCMLKGNMGPGGDPEINVQAIIKNNVLSTPGGGVVDSCNFTGVFTNNYINGKGHTDENSAIKLYNFKGSYKEMSFSIDTALINNLDKPIATGVFRSQFEITKLNNVIGEETLKFTKGTANVNLAYQADIVAFKLTKPLVSGSIDIKNADVSYVPRKLKFDNTAILLNFTNNDLFIKNIRLQSGKSVVFMDGTIRNFLNLYYTAPEKILLNWQIRSPEVHLGEFLGFLGSRKPVARAKKKNTRKSTFSEDLNEVFEKSNVNMHLVVDKVYYDRFLATNASANLLLSESGIAIKNVSVKHAGGFLKLNGNITQKGSLNRFNINADLSNVDIKNFFYSFSNFGLKSLTSQNLRGYLFSKTNISGGITDQGKLVPNSINGSVIFDLKKGALLNFDPIISVGKFAFPFRDLNNITFTNLNGKFDIRGQKITINPMQINSSLLNMDVAGIYSMSAGTNITVDVPLRNPKKDADITDVTEKKARRMKGVVLHLLATDGEDGKIKIKLNRNREQTK